MLRKTLCRLLCCIAILCLTAISVFAADWFNGPIQPGSISFDFSAAEPPVTGGALELRQVADWDDTSKTLQWCEGWESCGLSLGEDGLFREPDAAAKLLLYAEAEGLAAQTVSVGEDGSAKAEELPLGLYLVSQTTPFEGYRCMAPALISVPLSVDGAWVFDVEALPKLEPLVPETEPPTTPPPPPDLLPPTGQTNWPVPLLIVGGCFLILLGLCLRKGKRHETDS